MRAAGRARILHARGSSPAAADQQQPHLGRLTLRQLRDAVERGARDSAVGDARRRRQPRAHRAQQRGGLAHGHGGPSERGGAEQRTARLEAEKQSAVSAPAHFGIARLERMLQRGPNVGQRERERGLQLLGRLPHGAVAARIELLGDRPQQPRADAPRLARRREQLQHVGERGGILGRPLPAGQHRQALQRLASCAGGEALLQRRLPEEQSHQVGLQLLPLGLGQRPV